MALPCLLVLQLEHVFGQHLPLPLETRDALQDEFELFLERAQRFLPQSELARLVRHQRQCLFHDLRGCHVFESIALWRPAWLLICAILLGLLLPLGFNKLRRSFLLLIEMRVKPLDRLARARARDLVEERLQLVLATGLVVFLDLVKVLLGGEKALLLNHHEGLHVVEVALLVNHVFRHELLDPLHLARRLHLIVHQ